MSICEKITGREHDNRKSCWRNFFLKSKRAFLSFFHKYHSAERMNLNYLTSLFTFEIIFFLFNSPGAQQQYGYAVIGALLAWYHQHSWSPVRFKRWVIFFIFVKLFHPQERIFAAVYKTFFFSVVKINFWCVYIIWT